MSYARPTAKNPAPAMSLSIAVVLGAAVAIGGALIVGTFIGLTNHQWTYISIVLGTLVGLVVSRAGGAVPMSAAAAILSLAASAAGSVIGLMIVIVRLGHVPFSLVVSHIWRVFSLVPHVIGAFGFLCWALSAIAGWAIVRTRGRRYGPADQPPANVAGHQV
jgi:hypothetical protein